MYTSSFIRRHIFRLPQGAIFSTREMLSYGRRSAVDQCLYRLVKSGIIKRLAWGLFIRDDFEISEPSLLTVATEKAKAFCRQIFTDAAEAARLLRLTPFGSSETTYAIQGHSSSFRYGEMKIRFKGVCARKTALGDSPVGLAIKGLWHLGEGRCDEHAIATARAKFNRSERLQFRQSCHLMPAWMTEKLVE